RVDRVAAERRRDHADAVGGRAVDRQLRPHDDDHFGAPALPRIDAEIARAARDDEADVAVANLVAPARLDDDVADLVGRVRDVETDRLRRVEQALDVAFELEDAAVVGADALEDAGAVEQAVVEDADGGVGRGPEGAADVDRAVG